MRVLREWGDEVLVHQVGGDKLDKQTKWGHWIEYNNKKNSFLIYFLDIDTVKAEHNFCFVSTSHSRLKEERKATSKSQTNCKLVESSSENSTTVPPVPVFLSKIASNTTITNIEPFSLISYSCKPVDIKNKNKVNNLPEIPKYTKNLSFKAYEILKGKAVVLVKELDWAEVYIIIAEIKKIELLELANLKEAMRWMN